jgi:hypothetical protein
MALQITTTSLPSGEVGEEYSAFVEVTGGTEPYTWAITDGVLPDGLSLDSETGEISGTPEADGAFGFEVEVQDNAEATDTATFEIDILEPEDTVLLPGDWITYGTGRCSGLDELDGPGKFRVEVSDESWVARKGAFPHGENTTMLWPSGVKGWWKGRAPGHLVGGEVVEQEGNLFKIEISASFAGTLVQHPDVFLYLFPRTTARTRITEKLKRWIRNDALGEGEFSLPNPPPDGNFRYARLRYRNTNGVWVDWPIASFGEPDSMEPEDVYESMDNPTIVGEPPVGTISWHVWVLWPGAPFAPPAANSLCYLHCPEAPPTRDTPIHVPVDLSPYKTLTGEVWLDHGVEEHPWESPGSVGFIHPAELTRRVWEFLGMRQDEEHMQALIADPSHEAVAFRLTEEVGAPMRLMSDRIWGPRMLVPLKDVQGRMKLVDLGPLPEDTDVSGFPVLHEQNSNFSPWLPINSDSYPDPEDIPEPDMLDGFVAEEVTSEEYQSDTFPWLGDRPREVDGTAGQDFTTSPSYARNPLVFSPHGQWSAPSNRQVVSGWLFQIYQDGPYKGTCELHGLDLAEDLSEGDFALVDHEQVKTANAGEGARLGRSLVLILSLTRHPAHADCEYLVIRPAPLWICPDPEDPDTWWYSEPDQQSLLYVTWPTLPGPPSAIIVRAAKDEAGGDPVSMTLTLEADGEEVQDWTISDIPSDPQVYILSIPGAVQAAISDLSSLRTTLIRTADGITSGDDLRRLVISDLRIQAMTEAA